MRPSSKFLALLLTTPLSYAYPQATHQTSHQIGSILDKRASQNTQYVAYAVAGINQLQTWYNGATGLWANAWWNSANVVTMLADFLDYFPSQATPITSQVFPTTLARAPSMFPGFINGFYDDELWWSLAWIKVFDVTGDVTYLDTARAIFENAKSAWGASPCGGLWFECIPLPESRVSNMKTGGIRQTPVLVQLRTNSTSPRPPNLLTVSPIRLRLDTTSTKP